MKHFTNRHITSNYTIILHLQHNKYYSNYFYEIKIDIWLRHR